MTTELEQEQEQEQELPEFPKELTEPFDKMMDWVKENEPNRSVLVSVIEGEFVWTNGMYTPIDALDILSDISHRTAMGLREEEEDREPEEEPPTNMETLLP